MQAYSAILLRIGIADEPEVFVSLYKNPVHGVEPARSIQWNDCSQKLDRSVASSGATARQASSSQRGVLDSRYQVRDRKSPQQPSEVTHNGWGSVRATSYQKILSYGRRVHEPGYFAPGEEAVGQSLARLGEQDFCRYSISKSLKTRVDNTPHFFQARDLIFSNLKCLCRRLEVSRKPITWLQSL